MGEHLELLAVHEDHAGRLEASAKRADLDLSGHLATRPGFSNHQGGVNGFGTRAYGQRRAGRVLHRTSKR